MTDIPEKKDDEPKVLPSTSTKVVSKETKDFAPKESEDIKDAKDRDPLAGLDRQIRTGINEASIDDFFESIGQTRTFRREITLLNGRKIELRVLSNKQMKRIFRAAQNSQGDRDEIEFNYLLAWESWVETDRGVEDKDGKFLPIKSYAVFCEIPWQIVNEIALHALTGNMGGTTEEDIKKNANKSQSEIDGN